MKMIQKLIGATALVAVFSLTSLAGPGQSNAVKKAIEAVNEAEPYDWKTLAESAKVCFKKGENVEQALQWIDKSIEINKDPMNLEIKGDYYSATGAKEEALKLYSEAITVGKAQNFWYDTSELQSKIWNLRS